MRFETLPIADAIGALAAHTVRVGWRVDDTGTCREVALR
jgi:hypothetical protein